ncbi:hypothetical protein [Flavobacterium sp.]|uniref:hypothetical protein n=1 Tax=Flavobacterium sp. TaxID=239 RepID=UPI002621F11D|nr:hypothetical protein [Flavobacterium sp.]
MSLENSKRLYATYVVGSDALDVLLQVAAGTRTHEAWCFTAEDDDDLAQQIPGNAVEACPVCCAVFEIQKNMRSQDARQHQQIEEIKDFFHGYKRG